MRSLFAPGWIGYFAAGLLAGSLCSQESRSQEPALTLPQGLDASLLRVPLEPLPPSEGCGPGWCAAEERYKVRFAGGFEIVPVLGESRPASLPLRWRTESLAVGGALLPRDEAVTPRRVSPQAVAYEHGL